MKKILTLSLLTSSILLANNIESLGLNLGKINSSYSKKDHSGSIILGNTPNESFDSFEIFTILNKKIYGMKPSLLSQRLRQLMDFHGMVTLQVEILLMEMHHLVIMKTLYLAVLVGYHQQ